MGDRFVFGNPSTKRVDLPIKRRTASRKTTMLGEVHYMARAAAESLSASAADDYILINSPTYVVLVDQYAVDLRELTPSQREDIRKALRKVEVPESRITSGALTMIVIEESEEDDGEQPDRLF